MIRSKLALSSMDGGSLRKGDSELGMLAWLDGKRR